jgi:hypothetical protein
MHILITEMVDFIGSHSGEKLLIVGSTVTGSHILIHSIQKNSRWQTASN